MPWPKGKPRSEDEKKRISSSMKGRLQPPMKIETKLKISKALTGREAWNKGLPMWWNPARMTGKVAWNKGKKGEYTTSKRGKKQPQVSGKNHWAWQGGITPINRKIRGSLEFKDWRRSVFERDGFKCVNCGKEGGWLEADHIKQFAYYPELRFEIKNGRTLCKPCHKKTETYIRKIKC